MKILCFGDSNTYGYDPRGFLADRYGAENRWVDLLAAKTGHTCINAGVNGQEIPRGNLTFRPSGEYAPSELFLVMLGTNDLLQGASAAQTAGRMEAFLTQLLPRCKVLLISPPPMKRGAWVPTDALAEESLRLAEEYRLLARRLKIPFVDTHRWEIQLTYDGVHFSEEGHRVFAERLTEYLETETPEE